MSFGLRPDVSVQCITGGFCMRSCMLLTAFGAFPCVLSREICYCKMFLPAQTCHNRMLTAKTGFGHSVFQPITNVPQAVDTDNRNGKCGHLEETKGDREHSTATCDQNNIGVDPRRDPRDSGESFDSSHACIVSSGSSHIGSLVVGLG